LLRLPFVLGALGADSLYCLGEEALGSETLCGFTAQGNDPEDLDTPRTDGHRGTIKSKTEMKIESEKLAEAVVAFEKRIEREGANNLRVDVTFIPIVLKKLAALFERVEALEARRKKK